MNEPFDPSKPKSLVSVARRTSDNLPDRVKGSVVWLSDRENPGYYLQVPDRDQPRPVEFIEDHWHFLFPYNRGNFTSLEDQIEHNAQNTGYWSISDPQHRDYSQFATVTPSQSPDPTPVASPRRRLTGLTSFPYLRPRSRQGSKSGLLTRVPTPPVVTAPVSRQATSTSPQASTTALTEAAHPVASTSRVQLSTPQQKEEKESSSSQAASDTESEEDSPDQPGLEEPVLEAQLQYGLGIEDREPENPLTPDEPAYQHLLEEVVEAGLNIPPPPPVAQPPAPITAPVVQHPVPQLPAPVPALFMAAQVQQQAGQQAAAAPDREKGRLRGETPTIFTGDRSKSETFLQQFNIHWGLNENHEIMVSPYFRAMYALSLMKGPHINSWVNSQVTALRNKVDRQNNPLDRGNNVLWTDFTTAFTSAYTDTAKTQVAHQKLMNLKMHKEDLDTYIATFEQLAEEANFERDAQATINLFAKGLKLPLLQAILYRPTTPNTMTLWQEAARDEQQKHAYREAILNPHKHHFEWRAPRQINRRRHPNDETVPMDVDDTGPPVFTQVRRAYTDEDRRRFKQEGRCFICDKRGHMARECPENKQQQFSKPKTTFKKKKKFYPDKKGHTGFRKSNQFKPRRPKETPMVPYARVAQIEEVDSDDEDSDSDDSDDVPSLAARTAKLSESDREQWVQEMNTLGINF